MAGAKAPAICFARLALASAMAAIADLDVLIVDDHAGMRALLSTVLRRAGAEYVREATGGAEALALLRERPAALILVDHMMPGMDGAAFTRQARESGCGARILVITGHAQPHYAETAKAAGANGLLVKPVSPRALIEAIEGLFAA